MVPLTLKCCALLFLSLLIFPSIGASRLLDVSADVPSKTQGFRHSDRPPCSLEQSGLGESFPGIVLSMGVVWNETSSVELPKANASEEMSNNRPASSTLNIVETVADHTALTESMRDSTPPPAAPSPIHTAAGDSVARHQLCSSSIDPVSGTVALTETELSGKLEEITFTEPELAVSTPPPEAPSSINTASDNSVARTKSLHEEQLPENLQQVTSISAELRGATPPPSAPSSINTATGNSVAYTTSSHLSADRPLIDTASTEELAAELHNKDAGISTPLIAELREVTPPPRPPSSVHTAAGDSIARSKSGTSSHLSFISSIDSNQSENQTSDKRELKSSAARSLFDYESSPIID